jgi:uncharacterized membrane protein YfcA
MEWTNYLIAALGAFAAGAINALAGGGTLITFPLLTALGVPPVSANITNTLALVPGYLGGVNAQRKDLSGQKPRLVRIIPAAALGGIVGGLLLLLLDKKVFEHLVPFLILLATALLAVGDPLRNWMTKKHTARTNQDATWSALILVFIASVYGGYFGGVMSVIVLAILNLTVSDNLTRLNALKQVIAFVANIAAALLFIFSKEAVWGYVLVMAVASLLGGIAGGKLAGKVSAKTLRWIVVSIGLIVSIIYFLKIF